MDSVGWHWYETPPPSIAEKRARVASYHEKTGTAQPMYKKDLSGTTPTKPSTTKTNDGTKGGGVPAGTYPTPTVREHTKGVEDSIQKIQGSGGGSAMAVVPVVTATCADLMDKYNLSSVDIFDAQRKWWNYDEYGANSTYSKPTGIEVDVCRLCGTGDRAHYIREPYTKVDNNAKVDNKTTNNNRLIIYAACLFAATFIIATYLMGEY